MNIQRKITTPNKITSIFMHLVIIGCWFLPFFFGSEIQKPITITILNDITLFSCSTLIASIIQFVIIEIAGYLTLKVFQKLKIVSVHNSLPYYLFLFGASVSEHTSILSNKTFGFLLIMIAIYQLFEMLQSEAVWRAFNCMFFTTLASIFIVEYILFIPFFWLSFIFLKSFTKHTFGTSFFGFISVMFFIISVYYIITSNLPIDWIKSIYSVNLNFSIPKIPIASIIYIIILSLYLLIFIFNHIFYRLEQNIYIRSYQTLNSFLLIYTLFIYLFHINNINNALLIIAVIFSFFGSIYYQKQTKFTQISFIILIISSISFRFISVLLNGIC